MKCSDCGREVTKTQNDRGLTVLVESAGWHMTLRRDDWDNSVIERAEVVSEHRCR